MGYYSFVLLNWFSQAHTCLLIEWEVHLIKSPMLTESAFLSIALLEYLGKKAVSL